MDEETLVRAARRGDREAFGRLVERYSRAVLGRQLGWTRESAAAEDLAQETFLRAWQGLSRLEDPGAFGSWLLSIAGYVGQEWLRRKQAAQRARSRLAAPEPGGRGRLPTWGSPGRSRTSRRRCSSSSRSGMTGG